MSLGDEWCDQLKQAVRDFSRSRRTTPVVEIVLDDRERFFIANAQPGPGDERVTLAVFPAGLGDALLEAMIRDAEGELFTSRVVVVHPGRIVRVELLAHATGEGVPAIGFSAVGN